MRTFVLTKKNLGSTRCGDKYVLKNNSKKIYVFDNNFKRIFKLESTQFKFVKIVVLNRGFLGVEIKFNNRVDTFWLTDIRKVCIVYSKILSEKMTYPCFFEIQNSSIEFCKNINL